MAQDDQRVRRTREAVMRAFTGLLLQGRYDRVTVSDVIRRSGVSRSTFYGHFRAKDDLLREGLSTPFGDLAQAALAGDVAGATAAAAHFWDNRSMANRLFQSPARRLLQRALSDAFERRLGREGLRLPARLVAALLASGVMGLLSAWLAGEAPAPVEAVAEAITRATRASFAALGGGAEAG